MLQYLKNENNLTFTENGAVTNRSSGDFNLDLFATIGAIRHLNEKDILDRFIRAFMESGLKPKVSMCKFWICLKPKNLPLRPYMLLWV